MGKTNRRKIILPLMIGIVLIAAALAACTASAATQTAETPGQSAATPQEVQRITLEDSKAAFDSGSAIFLDVRSADSYAASHIPGALSIPLADLETRLNELDPNQWIITYCT